MIFYLFIYLGIVDNQESQSSFSPVTNESTQPNSISQMNFDDIPITSIYENRAHLERKGDGENGPRKRDHVYGLFIRKNANNNNNNNNNNDEKKDDNKQELIDLSERFHTICKQRYQTTQFLKKHPHLKQPKKTLQEILYEDDPDTLSNFSIDKLAGIPQLSNGQDIFDRHPVFGYARNMQIAFIFDGCQDDSSSGMDTTDFLTLRSVYWKAVNGELWNISNPLRNILFSLYIMYFYLFIMYFYLYIVVQKKVISVLYLPSSNYLYVYSNIYGKHTFYNFMNMMIINFVDLQFLLIGKNFKILIHLLMN